MAQTPMDVFERMIHLSDNGDEATGKYDIQDNREYKFRLLAIINVIINELYPYSDTYVSVPGKRATLEPLTDLDEEINLDNTCIEILVHGAAAKMFLTEDSIFANYCQQEYERRLAELRMGAGMASESDMIEDVYSGTYRGADGELHYATGFYPHSEFSHW